MSKLLNYNKVINKLSKEEVFEIQKNIMEGNNDEKNKSKKGNCNGINNNKYPSSNFNRKQVLNGDKMVLDTGIQMETAMLRDGAKSMEDGIISIIMVI